MIRKTVVSPAGDTLDVLTDEDVRALFPSRAPTNAISNAVRLDGQPSTGGLRRAIINDLWERGYVASSSGLAAVDLAKRLGVDGPRYKSVGQAIRSGRVMERCVELKANIRRTFEIRLVAVPERWLPDLSAAPALDVPPVPEPAPVDGLDDGPTADVEPVPVDYPPLDPVEPLSPVEGRLVDALATSLLTQVIEIVSTRDGGAPALHKLELDVVALEERLGTSLAYVDKLRRQLRETGDELAAVKAERDGLRQRLRSAEHNLKVATSADTRRIIDAEVRKRLDEMMRERPNGANSKVAAVS